MLIDLSKLIAALDNHAKALFAYAEAVGGKAAAAPAARGRPAKGESAPSPEQLAASVAGASTASAAPAATNAGSVAPAEKPVIIAPTLQQVADAIIALANSANGGRDKAVAILTKYGVKKVPELKPENFQAVLDDVKAASAPSGAESLV